MTRPRANVSSFVTFKGGSLIASTTRQQKFHSCLGRSDELQIRSEGGRRTGYLGYEIRRKTKFRHWDSGHVVSANTCARANAFPRTKRRNVWRERVERERDRGIEEAATSVTSLAVATFYLPPSGHLATLPKGREPLLIRVVPPALLVQDK